MRHARMTPWLAGAALAVMAIAIVLPTSPTAAVDPRPADLNQLPEPTPSSYDSCDPEPTASPEPTATPDPTPTTEPSPSLEPTPTPEPMSSPTWGESPGSRLGSPEIFGYLPNWDLDANIDYGAITTIAYFGLAAGANGQLVRRTANGRLTTEYSRWQSARVNAAINEAHANGVKFVLTVERMAWDTNSKEITRTLLSNPALRASLVVDIVNEIELRGVDGVSLDFEPILSDQRDNFASFVGELRAALYVADPAHQLTFAATGSQPGLTYQMIGNVTASGAADAVIIMGYPLRALDAKYAGGLAPMRSPTSYDLVQITTAYLNQVAPDKIVMALPWYGRQWPTTTAEVNSIVQEDRRLFDRPRNIGYSAAVSLASTYGRQVDPVEDSAWTVFRTKHCAEAPETWQQVYYDDVETLGRKYDWVVSQGLAGVGIWALGYDNDLPEMWKLLRVKYRGLVDTSPPTGAVGIISEEASCRPTNVILNLTVDDGAEGSGAAFVRLSNAPDLDAAGALIHGRTYPVTAEIAWSLSDASVGGSESPTPRTVYVQWRDVAGNWSPVVAEPAPSSEPAVATVVVASGATAVRDGNVPITISQQDGPPISRVLVSSSSATQADGVLTSAEDFAPAETLSFSLTDAATGGTAADGPRSVYVQWQDSGGCWSVPLATPLVLDRVAPAGSLSVDGSPVASRSGEVQVLAPATDGGSGVTAVELSNDGTTWQQFPASSPSVTWTAGLIPDGTWTIRARWTDAAGNVSASVTMSLLLDRVAPTVTKPLPALRTGTQLGQTNVPVSASWQATDAGSGVTAEQVELVRDNGQTVPVSMVGPSIAQGFVPPTIPWRFRVSATDAIGNVGTHVQSDPFVATLNQENANGVAYTGTWKRVSLSGSSGGSVRYATAKGATAKLSFTGRSVAWVAPLGTNRGTAKVIIDGVVVATIDLGAPAQSRMLVFSRTWLTSGSHSIKVKVLGTGRVDLDAFIVLR